MQTLFGRYLLGLLFFSLVVLFSGPAWGDSAADAEDNGPSHSGFICVPIPIYTPETKAAFTLTAIYHHRENETRPPATLMSFLAYSQLNQFRAAGRGQSYLADGGMHVSGSLGFANWPAKFYGIGTDNTEDDEEDYTARTYDVQLTLQFRIKKHLKAGLRTQFRNYDITDIETGGLLSTGRIEGVDGGNVFGVGPIVTWDSKDDSFYPRKGTFGQFSAIMFPERIGDYDFRQYRVDLRQYIPVGEKGVFAVQEYVNVMRGDVPFSYLSRIGGSGGFSLLRGYYSGLFRERDVGALQVEYRTPVWKRLGVVVFAATGVIGHDLLRGRELAAKSSGGLGVRYRVGGSEKINLRLDFAVGDDSSGVYFNILESF